MKEFAEKIFNLYTLGASIIGAISGIAVMYYSYQEKLHVLQEKSIATDKMIERLENEDANIHDVLHLHYKKMLELK